MSETGEATVEADGTTTFETPPSDANGTFGGEESFNETMGETPEEDMAEAAKGIDPAMYLIVGAIVVVLLFFILRRKKSSEGDDDFFANLDGEKVRRVLSIDNLLGVLLENTGIDECRFHLVEFSLI